jgi:predicted heme/steroid binding protein
MTENLIVFLTNTVMPKLLLGTVITITATSSGFGVYKLVESLPEVKNQIQEVSMKSSNDADLELKGLESNSVKNSNSTVILANNTQTTNGTAFDEISLALHNVSGDCFVAYNGTVYDVSSHSSWVGCMHHGISGGRDISSVFPHSTSYFASLPIAGTYLSTSGTAGGATGTTHKDDDGDENESEDNDDKSEVKKEDQEKGSNDKSENHKDGKKNDD